jgi:hypothetical protein
MQIAIRIAKSSITTTYHFPHFSTQGRSVHDLQTAFLSKYFTVLVGRATGKHAKRVSIIINRYTAGSDPAASRRSSLEMFSATSCAGPVKEEQPGAFLASKRSTVRGLKGSTVVI